MDREILIIVDPMCSWCWGFSPVLRAIDEAYNSFAPIYPIVGGLRPLTSDPMNDRAKEEIQQHWKNVNEVSGQTFDFTFFDRKDFIYDTEPACRALVTVRFLKPKCSLVFLSVNIVTKKLTFTRSLSKSDNADLPGDTILIM